MSNIIKVGGGGGGSSVIVSKSITQNGTYNASADSADGYNPVIVNVSGGGEYVDLTSFDNYFNRNTTTPTVTHENTNEISLSFTDQNAQGYELASFGVDLNKGIYIAEITADVDKNTGLATQYTWGIYSANATSGASLSSNNPYSERAYNTYVPFITTDTAAHYYEVPINMTTNGKGYICFATAADNGTNATISVRSLKIRKA